MTAESSKSSRVTKVHTPGEQPKNDKPAETLNAGGADDNANAGATQPGDTAGANGTGATNDIAGQMRDLSAPAFDLEALRHQIRQEEREAARRELGAQIQAASSVIDGAAPATGSTYRTKSDFRNMYAREIDHTTLTAPVMTRDGWLCPPAPVAKK